MKTLLVVTALVGLSACWLYAQTFGEVTGRVTDPSGAVIPGASVALTNVNTNAVRNVVTTEAGAYTFPSIAPGFYRLRTELPGFKAAASDPFEVQVQQVVRLDITLEVGQLSETVEVAATADLLQAETATVGTVVENKIITELPLNGRSYLGLVALAPTKPYRRAGSASCSTTTRSTGLITPTRISIPMSSFLPLMPFRSSKFSSVFTRRSSGIKAPRSTCSPSPAATHIMAPCSNSSATMSWTLSRTHSPASIPRSHPSSGMISASSWTGRCACPSSTTGPISYFSWPTTRRSAAGRTF